MTCRQVGFLGQNFASSLPVRSYRCLEVEVARITLPPELELYMYLALPYVCVCDHELVNYQVNDIPSDLCVSDTQIPEWRGRGRL